MADEATSTNEAPAVETVEPNEPAKNDVPPEVKAALRKANKEAETLRLRLQEFEDRDKTEAQKLAERAEAAEKRASELETRALRLEVAAEKEMTPAQAKFITGSTREEMEAAANELLETFKPVQAEETTNQLVPSLDLGTRGAAPMALNGDPLEKALRNKLRIS